MIRLVTRPLFVINTGASVLVLLIIADTPKRDATDELVATICVMQVCGCLFRNSV